MIGNITIKGRVTEDSVNRYLPDGTPVCGFTVALFTGKDAEGKYFESWWFKVSIFGEENLSFTKGEIVMVDGWAKPLKFWEDKVGQKRVDLIINAKSVSREKKEEDY